MAKPTNGELPAGLKTGENPNKITPEERAPKITIKKNSYILETGAWMRQAGAGGRRGLKLEGSYDGQF